MTKSWRLLERSFDGLPELFAIYRQLDEETKACQAATGLNCVHNCKLCCSVSEERIEASILEALPLSIHLWRNGHAEYWLKRLKEAAPTDPCVFLRPADQPGWGCLCHPWRPLVCRLFGFSASLDKAGHPIFSLCKGMRRIDPSLETKIKDRLAAGLTMPVFRNYAERVYELNPEFSVLYPINEAFRYGLEAVGLRMQFAAASLGPILHPMTALHK
jgi:Fe-S-cluster containining protein